VCERDRALRLVYEKHMIFVYISFWDRAKERKRRRRRMRKAKLLLNDSIKETVKMNPQTNPKYLIYKYFRIP